jgi:hypothetical protein
VVVDDVPQPDDRPDELLGVDDERHERARGERPRQPERRASKHPQAAEEERHGEPDPRDDVRSEEVGDTHPDRGEVRAEIAVGRFMDAPGLERLRALDLDHLDPADAVLEPGVQIADLPANVEVARLDHPREQ